jgi:hypothetical protein
MNQEESEGEKPVALDLTSIDTYMLLSLFVNLLSTQAWQHMGLRVKPGTDKTETDLPRAQTAIDCVAFLVGKLIDHVQEDEKRQLESLVADLQINFARLSKT